MRNTMADLNNYLFESIERINDDSLDDEGLEREIKRSEATVNVATAIIQNAETQLKAIKHMDEYGYAGTRRMPNVLIESESTLTIPGGGIKWLARFILRSLKITSGRNMKNTHPVRSLR